MTTPGLMGRVERWIDALLAAADDPQERVRALVAELRTRQEAARRALGLAVALEKRLLDESNAAEDAVTTLETRAKESLAAGRSGDAEAAAASLMAARADAATRRQRWEEQHAAKERVRAAVLKADARIEEVAQSHTVLLARARSAEASRAIAETLELLQSGDLEATMARAEVSVEAREAGAPR